MLVSYAVYDNRGEKGRSVLKILTGTPGGTFDKFGRALADAIGQQNKNDSLPFHVDIDPTDGSMDNCKKLQDHAKSTMSESIPTLAVLGQIAVGSLSGHPCVGEIALVAPLYPALLYLAVRDYEPIIQGAGSGPNASVDGRQQSEVCSILRGLKSIYIGKPESGTLIMADSILKTCQIPSAITRVEDLSYEQAVARLTKPEPGDVDAAFFVLPSNSDLINTLDSSSSGICFVPVPLQALEDLEGLFHDAPPVLAGSYSNYLEEKYAAEEPKRRVCGKTQKAVYESVFSLAFLVTTKGAPESIVETALDTIYQHSSDQLFVYAKAQEIMQKLHGWGEIQIHGAAVKYYLRPAGPPALH
ncbi:MAG: hypothetical protein ACREXS_02285 [Gammaproteobacteria bacterium]